MSEPIRPAYDMWPEYNRRLSDVVARLDDEQLTLPAGSHGWPIWAVVGHIACQRVFCHDVYHCAEVNVVLAAAGLPQIDLWD